MNETAAQTPSPPPSSLRDDISAKLPAAAFLRYESRADGWSAGRQSAFLAHLADHGIVEDAARMVGMSLGGGYALRRQVRGYAFSLGWEAALLVARRIVSDRLMTAAIKGEESRWVREEGVTTYTRQNSRLSLALLDLVNPATSLAEVLAVATRFDWFLQLIGEGADAQCLWDNFFDDALPQSEAEARARVRAALLLCEDSADSGDFDGQDNAGSADGNGDDEGDEGGTGPIEYKSIAGVLAFAAKEYSPSQFVNTLSLASSESPDGATALIEIEVQNETNQSQDRLRFAVVPRIGEGIRLRDAEGFWTSFDVLDVWYQKAEYGDVWVPYLHVRKTGDGVIEPVHMHQEAVSFAT